MKFCIGIKKFIGLIYILGFSFSVVGINKTAQTYAVDAYQIDMPFEGYWTTETNSGTSNVELCYTGADDSIPYFFEVQTATYYSLSESADMVCSIYYYNENNQNAIETLNTDPVIIHLDNVSEPQLNNDSETYEISGVFPNGAFETSFIVSEEKYTTDNSILDPHLEESSDSPWEVRTDDEHPNYQKLYYVWDGYETEATITSLTVEYMVNEADRIYSSVSITYDVTYIQYTDGSTQPLANGLVVQLVDNIVFDPEPVEGEPYTGIVSGECDKLNYSTVTLYIDEIDVELSDITPSSGDDLVDGWNYIEDDQNGNTLVWHNSEYPDATYALDIVRIKYVDEVAELIYEDTSGSVNDQPTATITLEEYNQSTFILSGEMEINGDTQLIEISVADANSVDLYQLWRYEDMFFWREWDEEEEGAANIYLDNLGVSGGNACFYSYKDTEENYFVVTYTNAGVDLPTIYLTGASYTIGEGNDEGCYLITGGYSELSLDSATIRIPESYVKIIPEEGWVFDEEEHTFVFYEESEPCDITYNSGYLYVYGNEKNYAELTYTATLSNGNEIQETFTLYDARTMTIDGTEQKDKVEGTYNGKVIQVFLPNDVYEEFVPNFDYQGEFIYWYDEGVYSPCTFSNVIFNNYGDESDYNIVQLTLNGFDATDGTTEPEVATIKEARVRQNTISGVWEGHDVSFTVEQIDIQNNITSGFNYLNGFKQLVYVDQADGIPQDVAILGAIYDGRDSSQATFEVSYEINGNQQQSGTFTLTDAYIIKQPYDDPYEPGEIYGVWSVIGDEGIYLTTPHISSVEAPYWTFKDGDFIYIDPENEEIYADMVTCIYREDEAEMELNYYIFNPLDQDSYDTATLLITDVNSVVDYDAENKTPGSAKGRAAFVDEQNEITFKIYVAIDRPTPTIEFNSGWNYIENNLIWYDESLGTRETEVNNIKLFKEEQSQTIVSAEIQFSIYGLVREDPDYIAYETIELTEVSILSEPDAEEQVPGVLEGYFATLSRRVGIEFFTYSVEIIKDETGGGDETPATATDEQQAEIIEFLPEITSETTEEEKQNKERAEQNVAQLSEKAAADILTAVTSTQDKIVAERDAKIAEATTQEEKDQANKEYQEKREIIETVATASVVVAVGQQTASEQGTKIDNCLPSDSGLESMDTTLNKFYETQMDYLLGKKVAPKTRRILRGNEPASASDNILSVSKDEYGKMIKFVDTAVSNMKNAALHIRKCSCVGMKNVVKSYISLVKIDTFRDFDETEANDKFVAAIYEATMLNMQQQVVEALKREHKPSNNAERERQFEEQLAACNDYKTFEQIVIEVLRLKYDSLEGEKLEYTDVDDFFEKIYMPIFRSWALDDPSINPTNITLEELTKATIETTTSKASKMTYRADISKQESVFLIAFGSALGVGIATSIALPLILKKRRLVK